MPLLRCLQTLTAAAALFAILGACGLAPAISAPRPIVRPHPPRPPRQEVTVRSLTGRWAGIWQTPDDIETVTLSIQQRGDALAGTLSVHGRTLASDPARPAHLDVTGQFALEVGQAPETVVVQGRPDATGDRISASIRGLSAPSITVTFRRQ